MTVHLWASAGCYGCDFDLSAQHGIAIVEQERIDKIAVPWLRDSQRLTKVHLPMRGGLTKPTFSAISA